MDESVDTVRKAIISRMSNLMELLFIAAESAPKDTEGFVAHVITHVRPSVDRVAHSLVFALSTDASLTQENVRILMCLFESWTSIWISVPLKEIAKISSGEHEDLVDVFVKQVHSIVIQTIPSIVMQIRSFVRFFSTTVDCKEEIK